MILDILKLAVPIIDTVFETDAEKAAAQARLMKAEQEGRLQDAQVRLSAIIAEAKSNDPWTSRARPTFLYVVYIFLLSSIPFGVLFYVNPEAADAVTVGMGAWFDSLPEEIYWLFGTGYLGYSAARSYDKRKGANHG